jgi:hypothetical protein
MAIQSGKFDKSRVTFNTMDGSASLPLAKPVKNDLGEVQQVLKFRAAEAEDLDVWDMVKENQAGMRALLSRLTGQPRSVIDHLCLYDLSQCAGLISSFFEEPPSIG